MASRFMLRSPRLQARGNPMSSRSSLQHQRRARLRARHHPRYPRARMRAGADEIVVGDVVVAIVHPEPSSEEHTSALQSLMRFSYAVFCLQKQIPSFLFFYFFSLYFFFFFSFTFHYFFFFLSLIFLFS